MAQLINGIPKEVPIDDGSNIVPVNYGDGDLPEPAVPEPTTQSYSMEVYKGANSETITFDVASY